jgi:hypothetical protein
MTKHIPLAVHDQAGELDMIQRKLVSRYATDDKIICERSAASALQRLDALRSAGDTRVLVLFAAHAVLAAIQGVAAGPVRPADQLTGDPLSGTR